MSYDFEILELRKCFVYKCLKEMLYVLVIQVKLSLYECIVSIFRSENIVLKKTVTTVSAKPTCKRL